MQPYFFPYLGYFQLVNAVDTFVFYDTVNFINRGWINRNYLKNNMLFTIPILNKSQYVAITDTKVDWSSNKPKKLLKSLSLNYSKSPYKDEVISLVEKVLETKPTTISELAISSISAVCKYLGITTTLKVCSEEKYDQSSDRVGNLISICKSEGGTDYINAIGGASLYSDEDFSKENISLRFINTQNSASILDTMMDYSVDKISSQLAEYQLKEYSHV